MAKFAVLLCVFLLAGYGAQSSLAESLTSGLEEKIAEAKEQLGALLEKLQELAQNGAALVEAATDKLKEKAAEYRAELEAKIAELKDEAEIWKDCVEQNNNFSEVVDQVETEAFACLGQAESTFKASVADAQSTAALAKAFVEEWEACDNGDTMSTLVCRAMFVASNQEEFAKIWEAVKSDTDQIRDASSQLKEDLEQCATAAAEDLDAAAKAIYASVAECVSNA